MGFADTNVRVILEGIGPVKVSLATPVSRGDLLTISGSQFVLATAVTATSLWGPILVAGETGETDDVITAFMAAVVGGFPSASALKTLYLSDTAGNYASAAGSTTVVVGAMAASTVAVIRAGWAVA